MKLIFSLIFIFTVITTLLYLFFSIVNYNILIKYWTPEQRIVFEIVTLAIDEVSSIVYIQTENENNEFKILYYEK